MAGEHQMTHREPHEGLTLLSALLCLRLPKDVEPKLWTAAAAPVPDVSSTGGDT